MVHDLVVPAELRVLVLERVEAVRALRDDLLHAQPVERLDVLHREHLEDVLVARSAGRVAGAQLARSEHGEVEVRPLQQPGQRARVVFLLRSSNDPAQPTHIRYSWSKGPEPSITFTPSSEAAQSPRSPWFIPYTFDEFSIERYVLPSSAGKSLSMSER